MIETFFNNARLVVAWFSQNIIANFSGSVLAVILGVYLVLVLFVGFIRSYIFPN